MKYLILILISLNLYAETRVPSVPLSDAEKYVNAKTLEELDFFKHTCVSKPDEPCLIAECEPKYSKLETRTSYDEFTGITTETKVLVCDPEKEALIKGLEKVREDQLKEEQSQKNQACNALKGLENAIDQLESNLNGSTIAALRAEINAKNALSVQVLKNVQRCLR
jgi:hypothetical protein